MTAVTEAGRGVPALPPADTKPVTIGRVIRSEWIKFTTLRSTLAVLGAAMLGMVAIGAILGYNTRHLTPNLDPNDIAASSPLQGYYLGQLLIGVLGVLFVTGEYSTGMIRTTMVAVPKRLPVLWAKLLVFVGVTLTTMVTMSIAAFLVGEGIIGHYRPAYSLSSPHALRVVIGTGVYLTFMGMIGAGIGWIVRSTPGAIVTYLGLILVIPVLFGNVLGNWGKHVAEYLPSQAGSAFISIIPDGLSASPWVGIFVMAGWVAAVLAVAYAVLRMGDT
jgi:ABC-2 type transport system permease protein